MGRRKSSILRNDHLDSLGKSYMKFPLPLLRLLPLFDSDTLMKEGRRQGSGGEGGGGGSGPWLMLMDCHLGVSEFLFLFPVTQDHP